RAHFIGGSHRGRPMAGLGCPDWVHLRFLRLRDMKECTPVARTIRTLAAVAGAVVALSLTACSDDGDEPQRDESGQVTQSAGAADIFDGKVGDCLVVLEVENESTDVA